ncbi:hypothetical protein TNCT_248791 [Trichonephila clavata]|uniref:Uncharacterized protein n=1 Tax=Trichonephila clavata TaxID=2740835 RepID=A0A8X6GQ52_TRICU|nr:hypothetical protein TNCT_248791 [Trichonephila clavata]
MTVSWILEGFFYSLPFILAILTQGNLPSWIQILFYATIGEFINNFLLLKYGAKPDSHFKSSSPKIKTPNTERKNIPIVHSLMIFKICEALDIQVKFAPTEKRNFDFKICENQAKNKSNNPNVQLEKVDLLFKERNITTIKSPIAVNSLMVYKMSQALGFDTELKPVKYSEPFVTQMKRKGYIYRKENSYCKISRNFKIL